MNDEWLDKLQEKGKGHGFVLVLGTSSWHVEKLKELNPAALIICVDPAKPFSDETLLPEERFLAQRDGLLAVVLPGVRDRYPKESEYFGKYVVLLNESLRMHDAGFEYHHQIWQENSIRNVPAMSRAMPVSRLFGKWRGKPVLMIGGGPSCDRELEHIRQAKGRLLLMASGTALSWCNRHGIEPDFVVSVDPLEGNYLAHFKGQGLDVPLIFDHLVHYEIPRNWPGPLYALTTVDPCYLERFVFKRSFGLVKCDGPSVMNVMFLLARKMGARPIVLIGQDCCFDGNQTHAEGTHHGGKPDVVRDDSLLVKIQGVKKQSVDTIRQLRQCVYFYEQNIQPGDTVVNCSFGARIPYTHDLELSQIVSMAPELNVKFKHQKPKFNQRKITAELQKIKKWGEGILGMDSIEYEELLSFMPFHYCLLPIAYRKDNDTTGAKEFIGAVVDCLDETIEEMKCPVT